MARDSFSFEGLISIEKRLLRRAEDIGYIKVQDRTVPRKDETLGRFDFTTECAFAWLHDVRIFGADGTDVDDEEESSSAELAEAAGFDGELPPEPDEPMPMDDIARAACAWIKDIALRNTVGEKFRRFRVKVFSPKGARLIDSGQFVCRNHDADLELPEIEGIDPELKIPTPSFDQAAALGGVKAIKALGDYYAQWGQIVLGSVGQLQGVNNTMLTRLHKQLQESREQVDQLVGAILEYRFQQSVAEDQRNQAEREGDTRAALARDAINQLGEAARAFLAARGVSPEMADLLVTLSASPDLTAALSDPDVRSLMQDPSNLTTLAAMLRQIGAQARMAREQATQQEQAQGQQHQGQQHHHQGQGQPQGQPSPSPASTPAAG